MKRRADGDSGELTDAKRQKKDDPKDNKIDNRWQRWRLERTPHPTPMYLQQEFQSQWKQVYSGMIPAISNLILDYVDCLDQLLWRRLALKAANGQLLFDGAPCERVNVPLPASTNVCQRENCNCGSRIENFANPNPPVMHLFKKISDATLYRNFSSAGPTGRDQTWTLTHTGHLVELFLWPYQLRGREPKTSDDFLFYTKNAYPFDLVDRTTGEVLCMDVVPCHYSGYLHQVKPKGQECESIMRLVVAFSLDGHPEHPDNKPFKDRWDGIRLERDHCGLQCVQCETFPDRMDSREAIGLMNAQFGWLDFWLQEFHLGDVIQTNRGPTTVVI